MSYLKQATQTAKNAVKQKEQKSTFLHLYTFCYSTQS